MDDISSSSDNVDDGNIDDTKDNRNELRDLIDTEDAFLFMDEDDNQVEESMNTLTITNKIFCDNDAKELFLVNVNNTFCECRSKLCLQTWINEKDTIRNCYLCEKQFESMSIIHVCNQCNRNICDGCTVALQLKINIIKNGGLKSKSDLFGQIHENNTTIVSKVE